VRAVVHVLGLLLWLPVAVSCSAFGRDITYATPGPMCASSSDPAPQRAACAFGPGAVSGDTIACPPSGTSLPIDHIIVLIKENRSFDHYLGHLPGHGQDDVDVADASASNPAADGVSPAVPWFHLTDACFDDTDHGWDATHLAWGGGRNDGFVAGSAGAGDAEGNDPGGTRAMGYYDESDIPFYYRLASTFAISDRYFSDVIGPTFPNRLFGYAGTSFGIVDDSVDTGFHPTIFEMLNDRGVDWKVYESTVAAGFITLSFALDSLGKVKDLDDFFEDARNGTLPTVAWVDPSFLVDQATSDDEHPPADMQVGQAMLQRVVSALMASPSWPTSAMFITYDEAGGLYDHVPPPPACPPDDTPPAQDAFLGGFDRYGFRVPLFVVSPFAKAHFVSHTVHSAASILRFIETKLGLPALTARDANSDALLDMFDFASPPFLTPPDLPAPDVDQAKLDACVARYGQ